MCMCQLSPRMREKTTYLIDLINAIKTVCIDPNVDLCRKDFTFSHSAFGLQNEYRHEPRLAVFVIVGIKMTTLQHESYSR